MVFSPLKLTRRRCLSRRSIAVILPWLSLQAENTQTRGEVKIQYNTTLYLTWNTRLAM